MFITLFIILLLRVPNLVNRGSYDFSIILVIQKCASISCLFCLLKFSLNICFFLQAPNIVDCFRIIFYKLIYN